MSTSKKPSVLRVSDKLSLPLAYATQRNAVLAMSGAGKSNLCVVLAEEMSRCGVPWVAIDPKGDWWGVRAEASGKGRGLDVPILGGEHGDLPLSPRAGARMAELVASGKLQGVFDVSGFDQDELGEFLIAFGTVLLKQLRTPLHVFCEECSDYLPQPGSSGRLDKVAAQCLKVWKKLSTQGRFRGLGYTLISQRAAMVNKSALYQCETLIAMRVVGEHDKKAVRTWIEQQADATSIMKTLPLLEDGEAWLCSPQKLKLVERVKFRRRETFDSGRTPEIGEAFKAPKLSAIDVGALRAEMEAFDATPEHDNELGSDAEDMAEELAEVRGRVAELEAALAAAPKLSEDTVSRLEVAVNRFHDTSIAAVEAARDVMAALPGSKRTASLTALLDDVEECTVLGTPMIQQGNSGREWASIAMRLRPDPRLAEMIQAGMTSGSVHKVVLGITEFAGKFTSCSFSEQKNELSVVFVGEGMPAPGYARGLVPNSVQDDPAKAEMQPRKAGTSKGVFPVRSTSSLPDMPARRAPRASSMERDVLENVAQHPQKRLTKNYLAGLIGCHHATKSFTGAIAALQARGALTPALAITIVGSTELGKFDAIPKGGKARFEWYCKNKLEPREVEVLRAIAAGSYRSKHELSQALGCHHATKSFTRALKRLTALHLIVGVRLSQELSGNV